MFGFGKKQIGLGTKLVISLVGSLVIIFGLLTYSNLLQHRKHLEVATIGSALRIADTIGRSIDHHMLRDECSEAYTLIETIAGLGGLEKIRIFSAEGRISFSSDKSESGQYVDKQTEACLACHSEKDPAQSLDKSERFRIFKKSDNNRVLGLIYPIENKPQCSNASCHYHPQELRILGVLDVIMSLHEIDEEIAFDMGQTAVAYLLTMLLVALISITFVTFMIDKPVSQLIEKTKQAAKGQLDQRLVVNTRDQLGQLALSFNTMMNDLKLARDEITNWNKTLEQRVEEKTEELNTAHSHLIRIEKMVSLGKLSAIVAHEINNPLSGVLNYSKILSRKLTKLSKHVSDIKEKDFEVILEQIGVIETETARCGEIVKNLLIFARKAPVNFQKNDINSILESSLKLLNHSMTLKSIKLTREIDPNLPLCVCDKGQIEQVFVALIVNAIEASEDEGEITVVTRWNSYLGVIIFECTDTGIGMNENTIKQMFEPFFSTKKDSIGSGLGLSVVFGIIQQHKWKIEVKSSPGEGTKFSIILEPDHDLKSDRGNLPESIPYDRL